MLTFSHIYSINSMVAITPAKVPRPSFFRGYVLNETCAYHAGAPGHSIEHCTTLKHKVQGLIDAGWLKFEENRLWILTLTSDATHGAIWRLLLDVSNCHNYIFAYSTPIITSLLIQLPLECECKLMVCLLRQLALMSFDFQDCSIPNYSCYTFGESVVNDE